MSNLKFMYNGIKSSDNKLQKCWYTDTPLRSYPEGTITIYKREYGSFSSEVREAFIVENDSDSMTDYFEKDRIRVTPDHKLYSQVKEALAKDNERRKAKITNLKKENNA